MLKSPSVLGGFFYKLMSSSKHEMNSTVREARKWLSGYFHKNTSRSCLSFWKTISAVISYRWWRKSAPPQTCEKRLKKVSYCLLDIIEKIIKVNWSPQLALANIFIQPARYFGVHILLDLVLYSAFLLVISSCKSSTISFVQQDYNGGSTL